MRAFHAITLCTLLAVTSASAQYQAEIQASDTLRMRQLAVDLRASMGADRFPDLVDSLHKLVERLSHSTDPAVRKAVASGELQYQRFAAWRASFLTNYAEAIQHADTTDLLLGDRQDAEAVIIGNSSRRARMTVYSGIRDTLKWRSLHQEHMSSLEGTTDTLALLEGYGFSNHMGNFPEMTAKGEAYARVCITQGSDSIAARAQWYLGRMLWDSSRHVEALEHVRASRSFAMNGALNAWMPSFYHQVMAHCLREMGDQELSLAHLDTCMQVAVQGRLSEWYCTCAGEKAAMLDQRGEKAAAFALVRSAYDTSLAYGKQDGLAYYGKLVSDHFRDIGAWREALETSDVYHSAQTSLMWTANGRELAVVLFQGEMRADSIAHTAALSLQQNEVRRQRVLRNGALGGSAALAFCAVVFLFQRVRISREKRRSDELLLNILPSEVAEELKATGMSVARHIEHATILFTDFKGFTELSERLTPQELVEELDTCFKVFDDIITARGIEKIKTIGDAYMAAGGLQRKQPSTVADVVQAALDMQDYMVRRKAERTAEGKPAFDMRVGVHSGPVVAGIVGVKKFQYDIWGDTVNTASRMESSGEVGHVNISESTYREIASQRDWRFTPRGKVSVKGKGEMEMYFVQRN